MNLKHRLMTTATGLAAIVLAGSALAQPDPDAAPPEMGFFITSVGLGKGGDLGGLAGADAHCQALATAAGAGHRSWAAYLSTQGPDAVNARDRIGNGPWANAKGVIMATNLDSLHYDNSNFNWEHILDEHGNQFDSRIDGDYDTTEHDVLTGTQLDGTAFPAGQDRTCNNWTSSTEGSAWVPDCTQQNLIAVGGAGLLYCFATDSAE